MKIFRLIANIISWAIFGLLAILVIFLFASRLSEDSVPQIFGYSCLKIITASMEPTIREGDYILIKEIDPETLEKDDIITFYSSDRTIYNKPNTHRIYDEPRLDENGNYIFTTKGDNNDRADSDLVEESKIIGKYQRTLPVVSFIGTYLTNSITFFILVLIPCVWFFVSMAIDFTQKSRGAAKELIEETITLNEDEYKEQIKKEIKSGKINIDESMKKSAGSGDDQDEGEPADKPAEPAE